jgi:hypothetical protein
MLKQRLILLTVLFFFPVIAFLSCNHAKDIVENISKHGSTESHNQGMNCMQCHKKGGEGDGWFYLAGTAYTNDGANPASNVTLLMYTEADGKGTIKKRLDGDALGNFYSTDILGFGTGLYPALVFNNDTTFMGSSITQGSCNSCHGVSTSKIEVD